MKYKKLRSLLKSNKEETAGLREKMIYFIQEAKEKNEDVLEYSQSYQKQMKEEDQANEESNRKRNNQIRISVLQHNN